MDKIFELQQAIEEQLKIAQSAISSGQLNVAITANGLVAKYQAQIDKIVNKQINGTNGSKAETLTEQQTEFLNSKFAEFIETDEFKCEFGQIDFDTFKAHLGRYVRGQRLTVKLTEEQVTNLMYDIMDALSVGYTASEIKAGTAKNCDGNYINGQEASRIIDKAYKSRDVVHLSTYPFIFEHPTTKDRCQLDKQGRKPAWLMSVVGEERMKFCINRDEVLDQMTA